jgi:hypothetical protein
MADNTQTKIDMSAEAFNLAKEKGFGSDETKFKEWEKEFVKKFYEVIGLSDIPDEFLNFTKFIDAYSGVLVKSVQADIALMNMSKRLAMFKLSENIAQTAQVKEPEKVPPPASTSASNPDAGAAPQAPTGFDPLAK